MLHAFLVFEDYEKFMWLVRFHNKAELFHVLSSRYVFDYHPGEVYWCTADIGWITGHSYITYGPLANGATSVLV